MAERINILTDRTVRALREPGNHGDGLGLHLQVKPTGSRSWIYRYMIAGRRREMGLGSLHDVTLAEARAARDAARKLAKSGRDPLAERRIAEMKGAPARDAGDEAAGGLTAH